MRRSLPLENQGIVVTRALEQSSDFARALRKMGARVLVCPMIRIVGPRSTQPIIRAWKDIQRYHWLVFTSANGVDHFMKRRPRKEPVFPKGMRTCAIGPATAKAMRRHGLKVSRISKDYVAESVLETLGEVKGQNILIPRAAVARDVLPKELRRRGAQVNVVEAYRTAPDRSAFDKLKAALRLGQAQCVAFTSSSTVQNFFNFVGRQWARKLGADQRVVAASIGPITSATLKRYGWAPAIVARKPTTPLLAKAIAQYYRKGNV